MMYCKRSNRWRARSAPETLSEGAATLRDLQNAHRALIDSLAAIEEVAARASLDRDRHAEVVRRFADAKRSRAYAIQRGYAVLLDSVPEAQAARLRCLRGQMQEVFLHSAEHVRKWTRDAICWNWKLYGAACRVQRSIWLDLIQAEQELLYPLLLDSSARTDAKLSS